jgi:hypothetical protein
VIAVVKTFNLKTEVPPNHEVLITLPDDIPVGPAELVMVVVSQPAAAGRTLGDLLNSEFFGMWADREDITDSAEYARGLRDEAWRRSA